MKDLPSLPDLPSAMSRTQSRAEHVDDVVHVQAPPSLSLKGKEKETELIEIQIPQRMPQLARAKKRQKRYFRLRQVQRMRYVGKKQHG